jgi:iron complex transport system substrate-binding protein
MPSTPEPHATARHRRHQGPRQLSPTPPAAGTFRGARGTPRARRARLGGGRLLRIVLVVAVTLTLGACGGQDRQEAEPAGGGSQGSQAGFPVRIEHKYGTTEVAERPERVVTLGLSDHEPALALGVKPVGVVDWFGERPFSNWPWSKPLWKGQTPTVVGERDDFNIEKIADLRPDLIIAQYSGMNQEQYETLSKIAPVVAQPPDDVDYGAPWQEMTRRVGRALGQEQRAEELISGIEDRFARIRADHPEFAEQTAAVADSFTPGKFAAFASTDPKMLFLTELGFKPSAEIDRLAGDINAAEFSSERLDLLDVDRLVWLTSDKAAHDRIRSDPLYQKLAVHREGRDLFLTYSDPPIGAAMSFNTVLSIPYALDEFLPLLTAKGT